MGSAERPEDGGGTGGAGQPQRGRRKPLVRVLEGQGPVSSFYLTGTCQWT